MKSRNTVSNTVTQMISNQWTHTFSMLLSVSLKTTFDRQSMFQRRGNHILKGATFTEKNMLSIVPHAMIENYFRWH